MKWGELPDEIREKAERFRRLDYPADLRGAVSEFASELQELAEHLEADIWGPQAGSWRAIKSNP